MLVVAHWELRLVCQLWWWFQLTCLTLLWNRLKINSFSHHLLSMKLTSTLNECSSVLISASAVSQNWCVTGSLVWWRVVFFFFFFLRMICNRCLSYKQVLQQFSASRRSVRMSRSKSRFLIVTFQCSRTSQEVLQKWCKYSWALQNSQNTTPPVDFHALWRVYPMFCCSTDAMDDNWLFYWNVEGLFIK